MMNANTTTAGPVSRAVNNYLVKLRDSGQVNMFGAAPYLQRRFGVDKEEAMALLLAWMAGDRHEYIPEDK